MNSILTEQSSCFAVPPIIRVHRAPKSYSGLVEQQRWFMKTKDFSAKD